MNTAAQPERPQSTPAAQHLGVVVGFDGSPHAEEALEWGAAAAARRGCLLTVMIGYRPAIPGYPVDDLRPEDPEDALRRQRAEAVLERAKEHLTEHPGEISYRAVEGDSVGTLVDASAAAQLVVVGARGRGGFLGRVLGSVSTALPAHAHCPTVVVPGEVDQYDGPVVVGVDGSPHGRRAALHAAREAAFRGVPLVMVTALQSPDSGEYWFPVLSRDAADLVEQQHQELRRELDDEVAWIREQVPEVEVTGEVHTGAAAAVLRDVDPTAQLIVVGTHGRGRLARTLLGSVSRATLHDARRPVMVVPPQADESEEALS